MISSKLTINENNISYEIPPLTLTSLEIYLLSDLLISIRIERVLFKPLACAISLIGANELKAVLAPAFSTSEKLEAAYIYIFIHGTHTLTLKMKNWNTTSEHCVGFVSIKKFNRPAESKKSNYGSHGLIISNPLNPPHKPIARNNRTICPTQNTHFNTHIHIILKAQNLYGSGFLNGGGGGIRTHGTLARTTVFKTAPINRSGTPPKCILRFAYL